jgi:hypothetical protein
MRWLLYWTVGILVSGAAAMQAQSGAAPQTPQLQVVPQAAAQAPTGTVTGTVMAQDTQRPVRFAQVQLQGVVAPSTVPDARGTGFGGGAATANLRTDIDGTFVAAGVAPGDYYVMATATGYVSERTQMQAQVAAGADPSALLASLPQVHVTANATSNVVLSLVRGAALAGHVEWEDGSAAAGISVQAAPSVANSALPSGLRVLQSFGGGTPYAITDDRGNFRMSGLPTGDYVVSATIQPTSQQGGFGRGVQYSSPIRIYAPGVFRKSAAKPVSVRAGDERTDLRLVLDLQGVHTVSGTVVSSSPGQTVASGRVALTDASDSSLQIQGSIGTQGQFKLPYVPPGTYTLQISGASTLASLGGGRRGGPTPLGVSFQPFTQTLIVGDTDVSGVAATLIPVAAAP